MVTTFGKSLIQTVVFLGGNKNCFTNEAGESTKDNFVLTFAIINARRNSPVQSCVTDTSGLHKYGNELFEFILGFPCTPFLNGFCHKF